MTTLASVSAHLRPRVFVAQHMNVPFSLHIRAADPHDGLIDEHVREAFAVIAHTDEVFSLWKPDSDVSRLARFEARLEDLDPDVATVWWHCEQAADLTDGLFSAFNRPAAATEPGKQPAIFDPTGLVKGWALEKAASVLRPITGYGMAFCLNGGGDIIAEGATKDNPWRIGIEDAHHPSRIKTTLDVTHLAVATSGTYARGHHIYSPALGGPTTWGGSLTVAGPSVMWADVLATALFANPGDNASILDRFPGYSIVADQRG